MERVTPHGELIPRETRIKISERYQRITRVINRVFWNSDSCVNHSLYVGSYGRGTAIDTSDVDIIVELPLSEKTRVDNCKNNSQSYLLQNVKSAIIDTYPNSDIHADGQVVVINFKDGIKFEIVPVFERYDPIFRRFGFLYPDTNNGGRWQSTNPKSEQEAMDIKNDYYHSNGLLKDTCKHIRRLRDDSFSSYHLSGILIDSFVYLAIGEWHWLRDGESGSINTFTYEEYLLNFYNQHTYNEKCMIFIKAPGSGMNVNVDDWHVLGKILRRMAI